MKGAWKFGTFADSETCLCVCLLGGEWFWRARVPSVIFSICRGLGLGLRVGAQDSKIEVLDVGFRLIFKIQTPDLLFLEEWTPRAVRVQTIKPQGSTGPKKTTANSPSP